MLGFNDTSILVGHFMSSPKEREKRDRRDSRRDETEGQGRKRNMNERAETEEIKNHLPTLTCYKDNRPCPTVSQYQLDAPVTWHLRTLYPYLLQGSQALPNCKPISVGCPRDIRYMTLHLHDHLDLQIWYRGSSPHWASHRKESVTEKTNLKLISWYFH